MIDINRYLIPEGIIGSALHLSVKMQNDFPVNWVFILIRAEPNFGLNEEGSDPAPVR